MHPQDRAAVKACSHQTVLSQEETGEVGEVGVHHCRHPVEGEREYRYLFLRLTDIHFLLVHSKVNEEGLGKRREGAAYCPSAAWLATETLESCPTQASLFPEGENETLWTQPPPPLENSAMQAPNVIFFPQHVASGFSSISFT